MKQILLVDVGEALQYYLRNKLKPYGIFISVAAGRLQSLSQMRRDPPDLLIADYTENCNDLMEFLVQKQADAIGQTVPTIILSMPLSKDEVNSLAAYGIKKIITKPLRMDELLEGIGGVFNTSIKLDTTSCLVEVRVNEDIVFIEAAKNFNRDKIEIMQCKLREVIDLYALTEPFVLLMLADLAPSFEVEENLDFFFNTILKLRKIKKINMRVLTSNGRVKKFLQTYGAYKDIELADNMNNALRSLLKQEADDDPTIIQNLLESSQAVSPREVLELRFKHEDKETLKIAVVDDDKVVCTAMKKIFSTVNFRVETFTSGESFLQRYAKGHYQLIFLDLLMPGMSGIEVLSFLNSVQCTTPIIVLSAVTQRETVMAVLASGVKQYVIKPIKADTILRKAVEILGSDFQS